MMTRIQTKRLFWILSVWALCWTQMGCVLNRSCETCASDPSNPLALIARGRISWNTDALPPFDDPTFIFRLPKGWDYSALNEHDCQCLAVENSSVGELLEKESQKYAKQTESHIGQLRQVPRFKAAVLRYSALEARNQTAGVALRLFYQLAELEALYDLSKQSLGVLQDALAQEKKLKAQGLKVPPEFLQLNDQYFEVQANIVRIQDGIQQINRELGKLIGVSLHPTMDRLWPIADYVVADLKLHLEAEYEEALAQRPQILMGRYVNANLTARTLPAAMTLLKSYNSLLGLSGSDADRSLIGQTVLILTGITRRELDRRREQLRQVNQERERDLYQEMAQAIQAVERQANLVILAKAQEQYWGLRAHDLNEKWQLGAGDFGALTEAKLKWLKSRSALAKVVMGWHQAVVKWKEAKGTLVYECGCSVCGAPHECASPQAAEAAPTQLPEATLTFQEIAPAVNPGESTDPKPPH